jgi:hypothetical protein
MTEPQAKPGIIKRFVPWLLAIIVGIGVGWLIGGLFSASPEEADIAQVDTQPAPPPLPTKEQAPASPPARELGPPITLTISNRDCTWGADYQGYYRQAQTLLLHTGEQAGREAESVRVRVPDRPWNGLTVTAIEAMVGGSGIIFAEPVTVVQAALTRTGVRVAQDGSIAVGDGTGGSVIQLVIATEGSARRYGQAALRCGS